MFSSSRSAVKRRDLLASSGPGPLTGVSFPESASANSPYEAKRLIPHTAVFWRQSKTVPPSRTPIGTRGGGKTAEDNEPLLVCHLPQPLRAAQEEALTNPETENEIDDINGGLDSSTGLAWVLFGSKLYVWHYLSSRTPRNCAVLDFPDTFTNADTGGSIIAVHWLIRIVVPPASATETSTSQSSGPAGTNWEHAARANGGATRPKVTPGTPLSAAASPGNGPSFASSVPQTPVQGQGTPGRDGASPWGDVSGAVGIAALHKRTMAVVYWPDVTRAEGGGAIVGHVNDEWMSSLDSGRRPSGSFGSRARHSDFVTALAAVCQTSAKVGLAGESPSVTPGSAERTSAAQHIGQRGTAGSVNAVHGRTPTRGAPVGGGGGSDAPGCTLVVGCNSGELWRLDCSTAGVKRLRLGREAVSISGSAGSTFGMLAFGRGNYSPATVRGMVLLPQAGMAPAGSFSEFQGPGLQPGELMAMGEAAANNGQSVFQGVRQKSKHKKQQQQQQQQQHEQQRREKEKQKQAAVNMQQGGSSKCRILLLTAAGIEAWSMDMEPGGGATLAWAYDILGDKAVQLDLAGQKQVWLLDLALGWGGTSVVVLLASLAKDRATFGSYHTEYWLLSFILPPTSSSEPLTKPLAQPSRPPRSPTPSPPPSVPNTPTTAGSVSPWWSSPPGSQGPGSATRADDNDVSTTFRLDRKKPAQVFVPKARVEEEETLLALQLAVGGAPKDSALVLAGDGTATVAVFPQGRSRLYQVDPTWEAGRILGVSVLAPRNRAPGEVKEMGSRGGSRAMLSEIDGEGAATGEPELQQTGEAGLREGRGWEGDAWIQRTDGGHLRGTDEEEEEEEEEEGGGNAGKEWVVLTEKGGVWVIPENVILEKASEPLGGTGEGERRGYGSTQGMEEGTPAGVSRLDQGSKLELTQLLLGRKMDSDTLRKNPLLALTLPELSSPGLTEPNERAIGGLGQLSRSPSRESLAIVPGSDHASIRGHALNPARLPSVIQGEAPGVDLSALAGGPERDSETEAMVERLFRQVASTGQTQGVLESLQRAGAFEQSGPRNVFARASRGIIDTLAKQWGASAGLAGEGQLAVVWSQLVDKQRRHRQYLEFLSRCGCHQELKQTQRTALQTIMEHGEKLAAMMHLRALHNSQAQQRAANPAFPSSPWGPTAGSPSVNLAFAHPSPSPLWEAVQLAGDKMRQANLLLLDRERGEVFYARVSQVAELFSTVQQHAELLIGRQSRQLASKLRPPLDLGGSPGTRTPAFQGFHPAEDSEQLAAPVRVQVARLCQLAEALAGALEAGVKYREGHREWYPEWGGEAGSGGALDSGPEPWTCSAAVRGGLWRVAALCIQLRGEAAASEPSLVGPLMQALGSVGALLLDAYAWAVEVRDTAGKDYEGLEMEYREKREAIVGMLLTHAREAAHSVAGNAGRGEARLQGALQEQYAAVMPLAQRHLAYSAMLEMCEELNDWDSLRALMRDSVARAGEGRFTRHVFERCCARGLHARLLSFGAEFPEELSAFLQDHKGLQWLHDIFLGRYRSAASTMRQLALANGPAPPGLLGRKEEGMQEGGPAEGEPMALAQRRQLLCLAKLAVLADPSPESERKAKRIDADLGLLTIQEAAAKEGLAGNVALAPDQLVEVCLRGSQDLLLRTFQVFSLVGSEVLRDCRGLIKQAWLSAVDADPWVEMKERSEEEGWSDEQYLEALRQTALYRAAEYCYRHKGGGLGDLVESMMPMLAEEARRGVPPSGDSLREGDLVRERRAGTSGSTGEDGESLGAAVLEDSVEGLLTCHLAYPEAGEAMVTALRMGRGDPVVLESSDAGEEDDPMRED